MTDQHKCPHRVFSGRGFSHVCEKKAAYEHDGIWFCKTHHPPTVAQKNKEREDGWRAKWAEQDAERKRKKEETAAQERIVELFPKLVNALRSAIATIELEYGDGSCAEYRELLEKVAGGKP